MTHLPTNRDAVIAGFAALAIAVHVIEAAFPTPLPGIKPGLANVITLIVLLRHGAAAAAWVALLRVVAGSLIIGTFLSPTFLLSLGGALAALGTLTSAHALLGQRLSAVGLSVLAALAHMSTQVLLAWLLFVPHPAVLRLTPVLLAFALIFGLASGIIAANVLARLTPVGARPEPESP